jgi:hypothetical protein
MLKLHPRRLIAYIFASSNKVVQKKKASLRDKQIKLRAAAEKQKKMKH